MTAGIAWLNGPVGLGAGSRVLRKGSRTVLVVVPFMVAGIRLMDVLALLESDHRVVVMFTVAPAPNGAVCHGAEEFVRSQGGLLLPWHQAVQCEFDLVLAASDTAVEQLHGKVMLLPHGAGALPSRSRARSAGAGAQPVHGLDRNTLVHRGRLVPAALPLTHAGELEVLRESCPEAEAVAFVAGDICFDRLVRSLPSRDRYRRALGVKPGQKLVTVTSSWQPESTWGGHPDLFDRLMGELPANEYRVAAVVHPNVWGVVGTYQVQAWLADCLRAGLMLLPPQEGWRAALAACDVVIGDHGSVTSYGVAIGAPVLLVPTGPGEPDRSDGFLRPGSLADLVSREAVDLRMEKSFAEQLRDATDGQCWERRERITQLITSEPGRAAGILRRAMYRLLDLPEPARSLPRDVVPLPVPVGRHFQSGLTAEEAV